MSLHSRVSTLIGQTVYLLEFATTSRGSVRGVPRAPLGRPPIIEYPLAGGAGDNIVSGLFEGGAGGRAGGRRYCEHAVRLWLLLVVVAEGEYSPVFPSSFCTTDHFFCFLFFWLAEMVPYLADFHFPYYGPIYFSMFYSKIFIRYVCGNQ